VKLGAAVAPAEGMTGGRELPPVAAAARLTRTETTRMRIFTGGLLFQQR
jgi:hypothetical protein